MAEIIHNPEKVIAEDVMAELCTSVEEEGQVVVHCIFKSEKPSLMRIWPSTFLYDRDSPHNSNLVHAEKISFFPLWTQARLGNNHFTLIFKGLPKSCSVFDMVEHCDNEAGAFRLSNIRRNKSDVYYVQL